MGMKRPMNWDHSIECFYNWDMLHKYWLMLWTLVGPGASKSDPRFLEHWPGKILHGSWQKTLNRLQPQHIHIHRLSPRGVITTPYGLRPTVHWDQSFSHNLPSPSNTSHYFLSHPLPTPQTFSTLLKKKSSNFYLACNAKVQMEGEEGKRGGRKGGREGGREGERETWYKIK